VLGLDRGLHISVASRGVMRTRSTTYDLEKCHVMCVLYRGVDLIWRKASDREGELIERRIEGE